MLMEVDSTSVQRDFSLEFVNIHLPTCIMLSENNFLGLFSLYEYMSFYNIEVT